MDSEESLRHLLPQKEPRRFFTKEALVYTLLIAGFVGIGYYIWRPTPIKPPVKVSISEIQRDIRLQHARQLLGRYYRMSVVRHGEKLRKVNGRIYKYARTQLPKKYRRQYKKIAQTIIDESLKNEFDPVFLVSVIMGESSFDPEKRGSLDEIGLMQLRPKTGEWIAKKYGLPWRGKKSLEDPVSNIRLGAAYLHYLREKFDSHAQLYLAAYNMGQRNVNEALDKKIWPKDYPLHVMKRYVDFYSSLDVPRDTPNRQTSSVH